MTSQGSERNWPEAMATVLSCTYTARVGRAVAFGLPSGKHFLIRYNYWADDSLHEGEFYTDKPIPQGSLFPLHYDPTLPSRNQHTNTVPPVRRVQLVIGIAGSVVLSLGWLLVLHSCR
jgi:hypothetical protein